MNKKNCIIEISYRIAMFILSMLLFFIILWFFIINQQNKISNHFISKNAVTFSFSNPNNENIKSLMNIYKKIDDFTINLIEEDIENDIINIKVIRKGKVEIPKLKWGRFFNENDYFNNKYAVVGNNVLSSKLITKFNETLFYNYKNNNYKIIGIIDDMSYSSLNNDVFLTIHNSSKIKDCNLILDGKNINNNFNIITNICDVVKKSTPTNYLENNINNLKQQYNIIIGTALFIVIFNLLINKYYYSIIKCEIILKMLIGVNFNIIKRELLESILKMFLVNFFLIVVISIIINVFIISFNLLAVLLLTFVFMLLILLLILLLITNTYGYCINNISKNNI